MACQGMSSIQNRIIVPGPLGDAFIEFTRLSGFHFYLSLMLGILVLVLNSASAYIVCLSHISVDIAYISVDC